LSVRDQTSEPATLYLARFAHRSVTSLRTDVGVETKPRRDGRVEVERAALAPLGRPGLSRREQEISEAASARFGRQLLHAGTDQRADRVRARPRHSRRAGV